MIGFVDLGDINNDLMQLSNNFKESNVPASNQLATHICAFMLRGVFTNLVFPLAHFPTNSLTAEQLYVIVWELVAALEGIGLKVACNAIHYL